MFKIGDRVVATPNMWVDEGMPGTILSLSADFFYVRFDSGWSFYMTREQIALGNVEGKQRTFGF